MKVKKIFLSIVLFVAAVSGMSAAKTPVENLYMYELDNGLKLFTFENHNVPLVYIDIEVRAGAVSQTPQTAGLFHLYEHMMFKGNRLYPNAASVNKALNDLGVSSWNGATGIDMVKYFFTIPSSELEKGLAFWNAAIRFPLLDEKELENEKKVVLAEIEGDLARPGAVYNNFLFSHFFPERPYLTDPAGDPDIIRNATVDDLKAMKRDYYIPSNAALFVGGDINSDEVYELVKKIYGSWSNNGRKAVYNENQASLNPLPERKLYVLPFDQIQKDMAEVDVIWRGPDADFNLEDTYAADYLVSLVGDPDGTYSRTLLDDKELGIVNSSGCVWGGYTTRRQSGLYDFGALFVSPEEGIWNRASDFESKVRKLVSETIPHEKKNFSKSKRASIVRKYEDGQLAQSEVSSSILSTGSFWWTAADEKYAFTYMDKMKDVRDSDVQKFCRKYFSNNAGIFVLVHPEVLEEHKQEFLDAGYEIITKDNAIWWKQERFKFNKEKIQKVELPEEELYVPASGKNPAARKVHESTLKTVKLKNGIPVYIQKNKGIHVNSMAIVVKGGTAHLDESTSGLERSLFKMMTSSSKKFSREKRDIEAYERGISIDSSSFVAGSALTLTALDKYFYDSMEMFTDGFMNPAYEKNVYDVLMTEIQSALQSQKRTPESYLTYMINKTLFSNHPYKIQASVTDESAGNITVDSMKALHSKLMNPDGIFVVACGDIDEKKLVKNLNKSIGKLSDRSVPVTEPLRDVPPPDIGGTEDVLLTNENARGTGFAMRVYVTPEQKSDDVAAFSLATRMYSDVLYNVVREHYGTCYSVYSYFTGSRASFGGEYLYQVSDFANFRSRVDEARSYMEKGMTVSGFDASGKAVLIPVEDSLESYRNQYITSTYEDEQTSGRKVDSMLYNLLQFEDPERDGKLLEKLYEVTADDVKAVFNRYFGKGKGRWFVVSGN